MTMENTTMHSMDMHGGHGTDGPGHDGHDMGGGDDGSHGGDHSPTGDHALMKNYFHLSASAIILFIGWETMTWAGKIKFGKHALIIILDPRSFLDFL